MKQLFTLTILTVLLSVSQVFAQLPVNAKTKKVTFLEVVDATGMSAQQLYDTAKEWAKGKGFTVSEDVAGSKLVFTAKHSLTYKGKKKEEAGDVAFTFSIFLKKDKYRIIVTDFVHAGTGKSPSGGKLELKVPECSSAKMNSATWLNIKKQTNAQTKKQIADLKRVIKEVQNDPANSDDW
ncbi:MAG: DUF4468 domain-containing protein [Cytophagales bacterium]|nr:DUF4468 domain-containing protein [Cytophagales bacterium]